jgi:hypothetical protein
MNDPRPEALRLLFEQPAPAPIVGEYKLEQAAILTNLQRLKAERRLREASINSN